MPDLRFFFGLFRRRCCRRCERAISANHRNFYSETYFLQTHPQQNMIASGSMDSDLTVKVWVDRGST